MKIDNIKDFLKEIELFKDLSSDDLAKIVDLLETETFTTGKLLFEENTPRLKMFLIYTGKVELFKKAAFGKEKVLNSFAQYDFIGEGGLLDDYPHSTSCRTLEESVILTISREKFNAFMKEHADIGVRILSRVSRVISRRMRQTTNQVVDIAAQYISGRTRIEHDLLGDREVPDEFYYGVQTLRATENFNISGISINHFPYLIKALAQVKLACAKANFDLGLLTPAQLDGMTRALRRYN